MPHELHQIDSSSGFHFAVATSSKESTTRFALSPRENTAIPHLLLLIIWEGPDQGLQHLLEECEEQDQGMTIWSCDGTVDGCKWTLIYVDCFGCVWICNPFLAELCRRWWAGIQCLTNTILQQARRLLRQVKVGLYNEGCSTNNATSMRWSQAIDLYNEDARR